MIKHISILVTGDVQGVYFRATARDVAEELGLSGFVRNERDGNVYIEAEGPAEQLDKLVVWCKQGPRHARVENVEIKEGEVKGYKRFEITRQ